MLGQRGPQHVTPPHGAWPGNWAMKKEVLNLVRHGVEINPTQLEVEANPTRPEEVANPAQPKGRITDPMRPGTTVNPVQLRVPRKVMGIGKSKPAA
jgi:hypothetical protein